MRLGFVVISAVVSATCWTACSTPTSAGPAWPKTHASEADGGESLAPRPAARAIATLEEDRPSERAAEDKPAAVAPSAAPSQPERPAAAPAAPAPPEEIQGEDITIEVDD